MDFRCDIHDIVLVVMLYCCFIEQVKRTVILGLVLVVVIHDIRSSLSSGNSTHV